MAVHITKTKGRKTQELYETSWALGRVALIGCKLMPQKRPPPAVVADYTIHLPYYAGDTISSITRSLGRIPKLIFSRSDACT